MREVIGEYKSSLKKLFNSFKKRFGLDYTETLGFVDKIIEDNDYAILYCSSDITYSIELIDEINASGVGKAFGFYKNGPIAFNGVQEIREAVPKLIGDGGNKFIFVELEERSRFRLEEIPKTVFIKQGRKLGNIVVDIVKSRVYIDDEVIREIGKKDQNEFNVLYNKLYMGRWGNRSDIFTKNFKMTNAEFNRLCDRCVDIGAYVCYKKGKMIGFIVYEFLKEKDNRSFLDNYYLTVRDIYVVPEFRRQGVATRLFREVSRMADKNCLKRIRFKVWAFDDRMIGFVKSLNNNQLYIMYEVDV